MSQIHITRAALADDQRFKDNHTTGCFRRAKWGHTQWIMLEDKFIAEYNRVSGHGMCPKCVKAMLEAGKMKPAPKISTDRVIVLVTEGTKMLHDEFIIATRKYAKRRFKFYTEQNKWNKKQWLDEYGIKYEIKEVERTLYTPPYGKVIEKLFAIVDEDKWSTRETLYSMRNAKEKAAKIVEMGAAKYEQKEVDAAERHYETSVIKLAARIKQKNLNVDKMKVKSAKIDVNIDTRITDGTIEVHAWTIIAEGPIKRPHYRYIIK